jgi:hypothetical protein
MDDLPLKRVGAAGREDLDYSPTRVRLAKTLPSYRFHEMNDDDIGRQPPTGRTRPAVASRVNQFEA